MNFKLDDNVWFGDWQSPLELKDTVKTIVNVAHHFSVRKERNVYWKNLEQLPWDIFYTRLALKDHDNADEKYFLVMEGVINQAFYLDKLPILCHCQMGGHRGPTAGIMAAWILNGKTKQSLEFFIKRATELRPSYSRTIETPYRKTMTDFMFKYSGQ